MDAADKNRLQRIGEFSARRHKTVLLAWLGFAVALILGVSSLGTESSTDLTIPGAQSTEAAGLMDAELPKEANGSTPIVFTALDISSHKDSIEKSIRKLKKLDLVRSAPNPFHLKKSLISKSNEVAYSPLLLRVTPEEITPENSDQILNAAKVAERDGVSVSLGGYAGEEISQASDTLPEIIGLTAAVIILLLSLGTVGAMALPIVTALFAVGCGLSAIGLLGHLLSIPAEAEALGTMIGLGVGIDYSLFILTRYREARHDGYQIEEAIGVSIASAGSAVIFAGATVVLALCSLLFADIPIVSAMGYAASVVVVIAVCAAMTLIPAMLALLGDRLESWRIYRHKSGRSHVWARWAGFVASRPWPMMLISAAVLIALSYPVMHLTLGQSDDGELGKQTTARQAYDSLNSGFGPGATSPLLIAVSLDSKAHGDRAAIKKLERKQNILQKKKRALKAQLQELNEMISAASSITESTTAPTAEAGLESASSSTEEIAGQRAALKKGIEQINAALQQISASEKPARDPAADPFLQSIRKKINHADGVKITSQPIVSKNKTAAIYSVQSVSDPSSEKTKALVMRLRDQILPAATSGRAEAYVGGQTAGYIDLSNKITDKLPSMILIVVALSFVLLTVAFRSILIPLTAAVMNLLSVGAAYGVLVLVFQEGIGAGLIDLEHAIEIVSFVPLIMFAILFGLSMDYEVFLLSRIREHKVNEGKPNTESVIEGIATTGRVITSAAAIMFCVFIAFVLQDNPIVKQFGLGMAVAIAVDATLVRCLLVPSVMVVLGELNWWLPKWLSWLPHIGLDESPSGANDGDEIARDGVE